VRDFSSLNVLIAEDHIHMRKIIKTVLNSIGFKKITEATNGVEAVGILTGISHSNQRISRSRELVDLIICDWMMPNMCGLEVLKKVRAEHHLKDTPFLMLTSEADAEKVHAALKEGVTDYIVKPFTAKVLEAKIRAAIDNADAIAIN
jgi:two-component system chemotaxis response regulator CheY